MKTIKFFAAIAIVMGFTMAVNAQTIVSHDITANASVQTKLIVSQVQSLEFGTVDNIPTQTKTISVFGVATSSGNDPGQVGVQQGIGKIVRTGDAIINYSLVVPSHLQGANNSILPIGNFATSYSSTLGGEKTSGNGTVGQDTQVSGTGTDIFVFIGATVTPDVSTISNGNHTGTLTLDAEYN